MPDASRQSHQADSKGRCQICEDDAQLGVFLGQQGCDWDLEKFINVRQQRSKVGPCHLIFESTPQEKKTQMQSHKKTQSCLEDQHTPLIEHALSFLPWTPQFRRPEEIARRNLEQWQGRPPP